MVKDHSHCQDAQMIFRYLKKLKNKSSKKIILSKIKKRTCQNDDEHLNIHYIYCIRIISSYHPIIGDPTSRSHHRAKAALSHPWSLPKNAARYDSTDDVYDVRLGFLPKCIIYSEKKTSLTFCQILWARWKIARYTSRIYTSVWSKYQTNLWSLTYFRVAETQAAAKTHAELV